MKSIKDLQNIMSEQCVYDNNNKPCLVGDFVRIIANNYLNNYYNKIGNIVSLTHNDKIALIRYDSKYEFFCKEEFVNVNELFTKKQLEDKKKKIEKFIKYKSSLKNIKNKIFVLNPEFDRITIVPVYNCQSSNIAHWNKTPNKHDIIYTFNDLEINLNHEDYIVFRKEQDFLNPKYRNNKSFLNFSIDDDFNEIFQFTDAGLKTFQKQLDIPFNKNSKKSLQLFKQKITKF